MVLGAFLIVEKTGIRNEVAILDSRGWVWAGLRGDKASEGRGVGSQDGDLINDVCMFNKKNLKNFKSKIWAKLYRFIKAYSQIRALNSFDKRHSEKLIVNRQMT